MELSDNNPRILPYAEGETVQWSRPWWLRFVGAIAVLICLIFGVLLTALGFSILIDTLAKGSILKSLAMLLMMVVGVGLIALGDAVNRQCSLPGK